MKKLILLFIAIFIVEGSYALDSIGSYHTSFLVEYSNKSTQILQLKHIYSYAYTSTDNYTHDFTTYNAGFTEETNDDALIPDSISTKCSIRFFTYAEALHETYANSKAITTNIEFKPGKIHLGRSEVQGKCNNVYSPLYGQNIKYFDANYYIQIQPDRIKCKKTNTNGDTIYIHYDEPIRIEATKGFPKETYKWRYSYKNAQGETKRGIFTPYKVEDNGATIYVKGSDFLSESTFYELVYLDKTITITPDGADGYYKPISFDKINLTPQPYAPKITNVTFKNPKCPNNPATNVTVHLSRPIAQGESIILQFIDTSDTQQRIEIDASICGSDKIKVDSIEAKRWEIKHLKTTYKNIKGEDVSSHSEGEGMHAYIEITSPDPLSLKTKNSIKTLCSGDSNGKISCHITGGTGSKTYSLYRDDELIKTQTKDSSDVCVFTELAKGTYTISTTDINGCRYEKDTSIAVEEPKPILINAYVDSIPKCQGLSDGSISYNTSGGTGDIKCYLQNFAHVLKDSTYSKSFSKLSAGTYYLSATDANGCVSDTITTILSEPEALFLSLDTKNVTINGYDNGRLSASFSGGSGSYTLYFLNKSEDFLFPVENLLLSNRLTAGEGTVILHDSNNCSTSATYNITEPDTISAVVKQIDVIKCFGDNTASLQIDSIAGGMGGYTVELIGPDNFTSKDRLISNLSAGEYWIFVRDSVGAVTDYEIRIDEPSKINLLSSVTNTACVGEASGSILLNANGGIAPYKFFLNDSTNTSGEYYDLPVGLYSVSVKDENSCTTDSIIEVKTLSDINLNVISSSPTCYGIDNGTISISIDNGANPYSVSIANVNFSQVENNLELTDLKAGYYNIEVRDSLGCIKTAESFLTQPTEFNIELPEKIYLCNEQSEVINIENERVTNVDWYLNNDLVHTGLNNVLSQEGVYKLHFLYDKQCHSFEIIEVDTINKKVDANFLVAEDIPINDDAHLINITSKEDYDYIEWVYPENDAWVYDEDEHSFQLVFLNEGTYQVGMIAHKDKCEASLFKTIKTFTPEKGITIEENSYNITQLSIDKSPNNGTFTSHIEMSAKADVILYLYDASTGHIIATEQGKDNKTYDIPFSVTTLAGEYILLLIVSEWEKSSWIKMLIK